MSLMSFVACHYQPAGAFFIESKSPRIAEWELPTTDIIELLYQRFRALGKVFVRCFFSVQRACRTSDVQVLRGYSLS